MATDTQITNEAATADANAAVERFVDALNLHPLEAASMWVKNQTGFLGDPTEILRGVVRFRQPEELIDALEAAEPNAREMLDMLRADPELAAQFHESFINNPAVLENIQLYANEGVMGPLVASILPPEQMLSKIGELAGIEIPEAAMQDEAFKAALHNAVANDETVLSGMLDLQNRETNDFSPDTLGDMLADERARGVLTQTLNSVAENENIAFDQVVDFGNAFTSGDFEEINRMARELGVTLPPPTGDEMMAMMQAYINDPIGSARTLTTLLGVDPMSEQGQFFTEMFEVLGQFVEMILGGEGGIREYLQHYIPVGTEFVQDVIYRASGEADADLAAQNAATASMSDVGASTEEIRNEFEEFLNGEPVTISATTVQTQTATANFTGYGENVLASVDLSGSFARSADPAPAAPEEQNLEHIAAAQMQRAASVAPPQPGGGGGW